MTSQELVQAIRATVVDENLEIFKRLFLTTPPEKASDPYWKRALTLFNSLSTDQRAILFEIIRNSSVATASCLLGILDGENAINVEHAEMKLVDGNGKQLSGELQTNFLIEEERAGATAR